MRRLAAGPHWRFPRRFATASPILLQSWALQQYRPWMCIKQECRKVNFARAPTCEGCGVDKPSLQGWVCSGCETRNHKGIKLCRSCAAEDPTAKGFWACAACHKNNRVDDIDDNSCCGFCEYDMAPRTRTEADAIRIQQEISDRLKEQQEAFDNAPIDPDFEEQASGAGTGDKAPAAATPPAAAPLAPKAKKFEFKPFVFEEPKNAVSRLMRKARPATPSPDGAPGFDWMCRERSCGAMNRGTTAVCSGCAVQVVPADWDCDTCGAHNHWSRGNCFNCTVPITPSWLCSRCRTRTSIYDAACRNCSSDRPTVAPVDPKSLLNTHTTRGKKSTIDWLCQGCRAQNFSFRDRCFSCDMPREGARDLYADGGDGSAPAAPVSENNWMCDSCHASNFRTRTECWQCGKSAAGAAAAASSEDESTPQFAKEGFQLGKEDTPAAGSLKSWASDDWTCGKCFGRNFKSRAECHKCGASKTAAAPTKRVVVKKPVKI